MCLVFDLTVYLPPYFASCEQGSLLQDCIDLFEPFAGYLCIWDTNYLLDKLFISVIFCQFNKDFSSNWKED